MPHSLRAKIKGLRYKGIITDKDCDRLCKVLDYEDVLDKIRAEIEQLPTTKCTETHRIYIFANKFKEEVIEIIDKYKGAGEC